MTERQMSCLEISLDKPFEVSYCITEMVEKPCAAEVEIIFEYRIQILWPRSVWAKGNSKCREELV